MRRFIFIIALALTAALSGQATAWSATVRPASDHGSNGVVRGVSDTSLRFVGTMTVNVESYDYCSGGERQLSHQETSTWDALLLFSEPLQTTDGQVEQNPVNVHIEPTAYRNGTFGILSATTTTTPETGRTLLAQFWNIQINESNGNIQGQLVDNYYQAGLHSANIYFGQQELVPCRPELGKIDLTYGLENGAELAGSVTDSRATLEIAGQTIDRRFAFHAVLEASRA